jgi:hypothetical protein
MHLNLCLILGSIDENLASGSVEHLPSSTGLSKGLSVRQAALKKTKNQRKKLKYIY